MFYLKTSPQNVTSCGRGLFFPHLTPIVISYFVFLHLPTSLYQGLSFYGSRDCFSLARRMQPQKPVLSYISVCLHELQKGEFDSGVEKIFPGRTVEDLLPRNVARVITLSAVPDFLNSLPCLTKFHNHETTIEKFFKRNLPSLSLFFGESHIN